MVKTRLTPTGEAVDTPGAKELKGDLERMAYQKDPDCEFHLRYCYFPHTHILNIEDCGSCYGGNAPASGCCNTCEEVRESYVRRGWSFVNPDAVDQASIWVIVTNQSWKGLHFLLDY